MKEIYHLTESELADIHSMTQEVVHCLDSSTQSQVEHLLEREVPDLEPAQVTELADIFLTDSANFRTRVAALASPADAQKQLYHEITAQVAGLDTEQAVTCLVSLEYAAELAGEGTYMPDHIPVEEAAAEIRRRVEEEISPERVEHLISELVDRNMLGSLLDSGYCQIAGEIPVDGAFQDAAKAMVESAEQRAVLSAVVYAKARNAGIGGNLNPHVVAACVNASVEHMGIIAQVASGEIDAEQAKSSLSIVGDVVKCLLMAAILPPTSFASCIMVGAAVSEFTASAAFASMAGFLTAFAVAVILSGCVRPAVDRLCNFLAGAVRPAARFVKRAVLKRGTDQICVSTL